MYLGRGIIVVLYKNIDDTNMDINMND